MIEDSAVLSHQSQILFCHCYEVQMTTYFFYCQILCYFETFLPHFEKEIASGKNAWRIDSWSSDISYLVISPSLEQ